MQIDRFIDRYVSRHVHVGRQVCRPVGRQVQVECRSTCSQASQKAACNIVTTLLEKLLHCLIAYIFVSCFQMQVVQVGIGIGSYLYMHRQVLFATVATRLVQLGVGIGRQVGRQVQVGITYQYRCQVGVGNMLVYVGRQVQELFYCLLVATRLAGLFIHSYSSSRYYYLDPVSCLFGCWVCLYLRQPVVMYLIHSWDFNP